MKIINEINLNHKIVLINVDFDVNDNEKIIINKKLEDVLETITYALNQEAKVVIFSHLDKNKLKTNSIKLMAQKLCNKLNRSIFLSKFNADEPIDYALDKMNYGDLLVLEFSKDESSDDDFSSYWIKKCDVFVNEAFDVCYKNDEAINDLVRSVKEVGVGFYLNNAFKVLNNIILEINDNNMISILSSELNDQNINSLEKIINKSSKVLIAGNLAPIFLRANNIETGNSYVDLKYLDRVKELFNQYRNKIVLPIDYYCYLEKQESKPVLLNNKIDPNYNFLDIGKATFELFVNELKDKNIIVWDAMLSTKPEALAGSFQLIKVLNDLDGIKLIISNDALIEMFYSLGLESKPKLLIDSSNALLNFISNGTVNFINILNSRN